MNNNNNNLPESAQPRIKGVSIGNINEMRE